MKFKEVRSGLYLVRNRAHTLSKGTISGYSYLTLTEPRMADFNNEQIRGAKQARNPKDHYTYLGKR